MRLGNRPSARISGTGKPSNKVPGALALPEALAAAIAAARLEQVSAQAAIAGEIAEIVPGEIRTITVSDTVGPGDYMLLANAAGGPIDVGMPAAAAHAGRNILIRKIDTTANEVTIMPSSGDTVGGEASIVLTERALVRLRSDGASDWAEY